MNARELLDKIKIQNKLKTDKDLASFLKTNKTNIDSWVRRDKIPDKWLLNIGQNVVNYGQIGNGNIQNIENLNRINENFIKQYSNLENELIKEILKLSSKRQEYYYYKVKADVLEEDLKKGES